MSKRDLVDVLLGINWTGHIENLAGSPDIVMRIETCNRRIALWAKQLENIDSDNPALCFVRELQMQGHYAAALIGLALYKPAAGVMRAAVECALYYSYFRTHPEELTTLARDKDYFIDKEFVLDYHKRHTASFVARAKVFDLTGQLRKWYQEISAVIHGQIPGSWSQYTALDKLAPHDQIREQAVSAFQRAEELVTWLFLCTVAQNTWSGFAANVRQELLKNLSGEQKTALGLTLA